MENLGFRKAEAATKNQNFISFWYIFTMRESIEVETQQLADCVILPSNTSYSLVNATQKGTGMERPPGQPRVSKALKAPEPPPCSQDSQCSGPSHAFQCFAEGIKGTWCCGKQCATSAWVLLTEQSCTSRICWEVNPEDIWESHLEVAAAHKLCCTRDSS